MIIQFHKDFFSAKPISSAGPISIPKKLIDFLRYPFFQMDMLHQNQEIAENSGLCSRGG